MGGIGKRFGSEVPKQYHRLSGKPIYLVTLEAFLLASFFDEIILCCHPDWMDRVRGEIDPSWPVNVVASGSTRQESSHLGLLGFSKNPQVVLIHDAVRPFVTGEILRENALLALAHGAVDTCIPSTDTLVYSTSEATIDSIPERSHYLRGQTPQSFSYPLILEAHQKAVGIDASDDCRLVLNLKHPIWIAKGSEQNIKITSELDLFIAEQLFRLQAKQSPRGDASIEGKVFAVIGGSGGIGKEICKKIEGFGGKAISLSRRTGFDLMDPHSIEQNFKKLGPIHGLINCAGILKISPVSHLTVSDIDELLNVNLKGVILCCKAAQLHAGSHVINIASSSFTRGRKEMSVYSCAKAAVVNFTQALCEERPELHVHTVVPQRTKTSMRQNNFPDEDPRSLLEPVAVASAVLSLLKDSQSTGMLVEVKQ